MFGRWWLKNPDFWHSKSIFYVKKWPILSNFFFIEKYQIATFDFFVKMKLVSIVVHMNSKIKICLPLGRYVINNLKMLQKIITHPALESFSDKNISSSSTLQLEWQSYHIQMGLRQKDSGFSSLQFFLPFLDPFWPLQVFCLDFCLVQSSCHLW